MIDQIKYFLCVVILFASVLFAQHSYAQYPGFGDPGQAVAGGSGDFAPVEPQVDGGIIPLGATAQVVIRFRNEGGQPIQAGFIRLYPSSTVSAVVSMNQCETEPLPPGAECAVALSVKGLQSGQWRVEMLMSHSGRARLVAATVSGQVDISVDGADQLSSDIEAIPSIIDFGTLNDSQSLTQSVILRNVTSSVLSIEDIYIDAGDSAGFSMRSECNSLEAGQGCIAIVTWSPLLEGRSSGVLVIDHSGPAGLSSVPLAGEYDPDEVESAEVYPRAVPGKGLLVASQNEINFEDAVSTASTITVSLVNGGDTTLTIKDVVIAGSDNGLDFKEGGCASGTVLEPIEACPLTIEWSPTRVGQVYDDVKIKHDGARGVLVLPVRGEAVATVSKDQKAIVISGSGNQTRIVSETTPRSVEDLVSAGSSSGGAIKPTATQASPPPAPTQFAMPAIANPATTLDGYKITSFSPKRAIINGPGGSRIVFNNEETVLGGVPWFVSIQPNGIEFIYQSQRVLLLFDRSLSSINRVSASDESEGSTTTSDDN